MSPAIRATLAGVVATALALAGAPAAFASFGDLDPGFGFAGVSFTDLAGGEDGARAVAIDSSGRIVAAGTGELADPSRPGATALTVVRYLPGGSLDLSFGGGDGSVQTDPGLHTAEFEAVAIDSAGRIVAAGTATGFDGIGSRVIAARYLPDGAPDPSFGQDGVISLSAGSITVARDALIDRDGRIVVAAMSDGPGGLRPTLFRLLGDGSPDTSLGADGTARLVGGPLSVVSAMVQTSSGQLLLGGSTRTRKMAVTAIGDGGSSVASFGDGGSIVIRTPGVSAVNDIALAAGNRIQLAGSCECGGHGEQFAVGLLRRRGTLDDHFAGNGLRTVRLGGPKTIDTANSVAIDSSGRIAVGGVVDVIGPKVRSALVRLTARGKLDRSFSTDGIAASGAFTAAVEAVAIDGAGGIIAAGKLIPPGSLTGDTDFSVARYLP